MSTMSRRRFDVPEMGGVREQWEALNGRLKVGLTRNTVDGQAHSTVAVNFHGSMTRHSPADRARDEATALRGIARRLLEVADAVDSTRQIRPA